MALTWTDINARTQDHIVPRMTDQVYKSSPVYVRFRSNNRERFEGGLSIKEPIGYAELNGGAFTRGGTFNTQYVQTDTALQIYLKFYYVNVTLYGTDQVLDRGPQSAMSHVASKMNNASAKMAKLLATDMYLDGQGTGSGTLQLDGANAAIDNGNTFGSYAGIDRSDLVADGTNNQGINGYVGSVTGLSLSDLNTAFGSCWFGPDHVDLIATTQTLWNNIWNILTPSQRFNEESADVAKAGFPAFRFNGAQIAVDQYAPSGKIYGFNTNYIDFWVTTYRRYQFGFTGFKEAQNTDDVAGQYLFGGNFLWRAPRFNFILTVS